MTAMRCSARSARCWRLREQGVPHARCVILIEACEESGSHDLPYYVDHLAARIGSPSLVVCLDSGCGNYDQLWLTTSLRGMAVGHARGAGADEGVHSGDASGVVPSSFRILRQLLSRLEDEATGAVRPPELYAQIPAERVAQARRAAAALGDTVYTKFPFVPGMTPIADDLHRAGAEPHLAAATGGDRHRRPAEPRRRRQCAAALYRGEAEPAAAADPRTPKAPASCCGHCSKRTRPTARRSNFDHRVERHRAGTRRRWRRGSNNPWRARRRRRSGAPPAYMGEGGSIPFMAMLGEKFPQAQFVVTGVLGPHSNAHGPNEFLHIPTGKRVSTVIAQVLADHHAQIPVNREK